MAPPNFWILVPFAALHCGLLIWGLSWVAIELSGPRPPKSIPELKQRANQIRRWYLNPFHDRAIVIWKCLAWITGIVWLAASFFEQ
jgi:hypothetical protein